jgi:3-hydroxyisobutyrate dehydrogenase
MARIAFIGLGKMGSGMAGRLLAAGHQINVYNRTPAKAAALIGAGARLCASPAEAAGNADAVISMVADDAASREVWLGSGGVLDAPVGRTSGRASGPGRLGPGSSEPGASGPGELGAGSSGGISSGLGAFAIECSTLSHDWVIELAAAAKSRGLHYIDAPVTGLPDTAAVGELTLLVGAEAADLADARPILEAFSQRIIHFGAVGTGTAYKLIINMLGAVQIASAAESMALAERAGLDLGVVADAIATGQAASPQVVRNTRRMVADDHDRNITFTPRLRLKDVEYALRLARKLDLGAPFGDLAALTFGKLCESGHADENESNVILAAREQR